MRSMSTFGAFTVARMGIYASQKGLEVTGNNISNINTTGYSRRVLDQISFSTGGRDRYQSMYDANTGGGVLCTGVSRLRDPYLDIRFRDENSSVGAMDARMKALNALSGVLDEVCKGEDNGGVLEAQLNDLRSKLNNLNDYPGLQEYDSMVRSSAESLIGLLHSYSNSLDTVKNNQVSKLQEDVKSVNSILSRIRDLNESIRTSEIYSDKALDLRDERDVLLDDLSEYMKIDVRYESENVGAGITVERMIVSLAGNGQDNATEKSVLIDGTYATQISTTSAKRNDAFDDTLPVGPGNLPYVDKDGNPVEKLEDAARVDRDNYGITLAPLIDITGRVLAGSEQEIELGNKDLYGSLQSTRDMLTEAGEFRTDGGSTSQRGIPYYQSALDSLVNKIATVFNDANGAEPPVYKTDADGNYLDANGSQLVDAATGGPITGDYVDLTPDQQAALQAGGVRVGGALFSNGTDDPTVKITAGNIAISKGWESGQVRIVCDWGEPKGGPASSQANSNIAHLLAQFDARHQYIPSDVVDGASDEMYIEGTFQQILTDIGATLANDATTTDTLLTNSVVTATTRDVNRDSVAGVDLNDEAANLMMYQKSYAAACRLMTTLDEALDKLINSTGVVGR